jgi:hypothetical protein
VPSTIPTSRLSADLSRIASRLTPETQQGQTAWQFRHGPDRACPQPSGNTTCRWRNGGSWMASSQACRFVAAKVFIEAGLWGAGSFYRPMLTTWASEQDDSFLGYTYRHSDVIVTAARPSNAARPTRQNFCAEVPMQPSSYRLPGHRDRCFLPLLLRLDLSGIKHRAVKIASTQP